MHFHIAHNWIAFRLMWNIIVCQLPFWLYWYFHTHNEYFWWLFVFNWFSMPCIHQCVMRSLLSKSRDVMTLTLGPLAFESTKNMLVYISLKVLLEFAFVADRLKCFMYKLFVWPETTLLCKTSVLLTLKYNSWMSSVIPIYSSPNLVSKQYVFWNFLLKPQELNKWY